MCVRNHSLAVRLALGTAAIVVCGTLYMAIVEKGRLDRVLVDFFLILILALPLFALIVWLLIMQTYRQHANKVSDSESQNRHICRLEGEAMIMVKAPIFLDNFGDILVFQSVEDAERYIEPIDVAHNEYVGYDSEGRLLQLAVTNKRRVSVEIAESEPRHSDELRRILVRFLARLGESENWLANASLQDLTTKMMKHKIV